MIMISKWDHAQTKKWAQTFERGGWMTTISNSNNITLVPCHDNYSRLMSIWWWWSSFLLRTLQPSQASEQCLLHAVRSTQHRFTIVTSIIIIIVRSTQHRLLSFSSLYTYTHVVQIQIFVFLGLCNDWDENCEYEELLRSTVKWQPIWVKIRLHQLWITLCTRR